MIVATTCSAWCAMIATAATSQAAVEKDADVETATLSRVPPLSPEEAQNSFEVADGFRIEQVAAEPLLADPVAMAFDERGRLYVVEMCDYSEQDKERLGEVRVLTDDDGDGRFDRSRVFVDNLSWPTAIACYHGGVFIGAAPDILYCKDTDGDRTCDERKVVFTGFGRSNVQGLLNSFQWGLDHRIYGATSSSGGLITRPGTSSTPLKLSGRDFAFDPKTLEMEAVTGGGQHGMSFNRWGDRFVCHNSDHLQAIVFEERYLARNPYQSVASARRSIAADGPQAPVYRISPIEEWRIARTKMRVAGLAPGPIEGGGTPAGYFTSATGVTVYEGGLWDDGGPAWAIVADVGSNLIHRKRLDPDGVTYRGHRVDDQTEFVRSRDIWFRPVQFAVGPEGALYVADMYRETIEHPASLPAELKRQLDLTSGRDRGRIYRIVPANYQQSPPAPLAGAGTAQLIESLDDANIWRRMTALRLLYEQQDPDAAALLREQFSRCSRPEGRIAVLYGLSSVRALTPDDVIKGLLDPHPQVRRHALRLAEPMLGSSPEVRDDVFRLVDDSDLAVRFQLALSLGECRDSRAATCLAGILRSGGSPNPDIVAAVLTSVSDNAGLVLKELTADRQWATSAPAEPVLAAIVFQIVKQGRESDLAVLLDALSPAKAPSRRDVTAALLLALSRVPRDASASADSPQQRKLLELQRAAAEKLVDDALILLQRDETTLKERLAAIENLSLGSFEDERKVLEGLLMPHEPTAVHQAVFKTCASFDAPEVADMVLAQWEQLTPSERTQATKLLLCRKAWALALLHYFSDKGVPLGTLDLGHLTQLVNYPSNDVRKMARALRGQGVSADRRQVFQDYREVLESDGDAAQGKLVFQKNCASCHQLDGIGSAVGPHLAAMINRGRESVLLNVLAPNGEVDPKNFEYVLLTEDGQFVTGIIAGETSTAVTLRGPDNTTTIVLRINIDEIHNTGKSLMPEGFEKLIDKRAMADLLAYLEQAAAPERQTQ